MLICHKRKHMLVDRLLFNLLLHGRVCLRRCFPGRSGIRFVEDVSVFGLQRPYLGVRLSCLVGPIDGIAPGGIAADAKRSNDH